MDTLTKLQTIKDFEEWAAAHKIDANPLALLEYLDQANRLKGISCETCNHKNETGFCTLYCANYSCYTPEKMRRAK